MIGAWNSKKKDWGVMLFSHSVMSDSLQPYVLQQAGLLYPPPSSNVCSNFCPLSQWSYLNHLMLCFLLLLLPSFFPRIKFFFQMNWLFTSGRQNIGNLASALVLLMNIQGWFPLVLTGLISLLSKGLSRIFSSTTVWKHQFFSVQPSLGSNSHVCTWLLEKP